MHIILLLVLMCTPESAHDRFIGPGRIVSKNLISWMVPEMTRQHGKYQSAVYPIVLLSLICLLSVIEHYRQAQKTSPVYLILLRYQPS
jgi:hypothetical protein